MAPGTRLRDLTVSFEDSHNFISWIIVTRARTNNPALMLGVFDNCVPSEYDLANYAALSEKKKNHFARFAMRAENERALSFLRRWREELLAISEVLSADQM